MSPRPALSSSAAAIPTAAPASARARSPWPLAFVLAVVAGACGILLTGVSVWFLGAVALAGMGPAALAFDFHTPAAFVRLFALGKTLGKYGERVVGHRAALLDQVRRRAALFMTMAQAPAARAASWQLGNHDRLSDYMEDVEDVDYAQLRVAMPAAVLLAAAALLAAATAWLTPLALLPIILVSAALAITLRRLVPGVAQQWSSVRSSQRTAGRTMGAVLASIVPLKAERAFAGLLSVAFAHFSDAEGQRLAQRRTLAALDLLAGLAGPISMLSVLAAAWQAGDRGSALLVPALVGFGWLALGESAHGISRIPQGWVRAQAAREGLGRWSGARAPETSPSFSAPRLQRLTLRAVPRQAPDGRRLGEPLHLTFRAGHPTALLGASGTGKTTLLKQVGGWIGTDHSGQFAGDGVLMLNAYRRSASHLGLHDAAILNDSVRENLFAPDKTDAECWRVLTDLELDGRFAGPEGLGTWISQDKLSLGEAQRLNLARALLSSAPLVLLDEPVEHLDFDQASRILHRVLARLRDRIVIYSSHTDYAVPGAVKLSLDTDREIPAEGSC